MENYSSNYTFFTWQCKEKLQFNHDIHNLADDAWQSDNSIADIVDAKEGEVGEKDEKTKRFICTESFILFTKKGYRDVIMKDILWHR